MSDGTLVGMSSTLILVLYILTVMRLTRLINFDVIMDWLHTLVARIWSPGSWQAEFLLCPWCVSIWVGVATAWAPLLFFSFTSWYLYAVVYVMLVLAASMITGLLARFSSEDTALEPSN